MENENCNAHEDAVRKIESAAPLNIEDVDEGHPAKTLHAENIALEKFLDELEEKLSAGKIEEFCANFPKLNAIHSHYGKKEFLFMPILAKRGFPHPSQFMWQFDDEIKKAVRTISKNLSPATYEKFQDKISETLDNLRGMAEREENIFIPMAFQLFTAQDWLDVYRDSLEMQPAFIEKIPRWQFGDSKLSAVQKTFTLDGKIKFPTGELDLNQLWGILKLLPVDITFIDENDIVRFFVNEGKIFDRPLLAIGNDIYACHPPQIIPVVQKMLEDFKSKKRASMEIWRPIKGKPVSVKYFAVYDADENYIGAVEFVQEHSTALQKFKV